MPRKKKETQKNPHPTSEVIKERKSKTVNKNGKKKSQKKSNGIEKKRSKNKCKNSFSE